MLKKRIGFMFTWMAAFALIVATIRFTPDAISVSTSLDGKESPICCVDTRDAKVALSFDVSSGDEDIGQLLEVLAKYDVKATFFMTGSWVDSYPETVKAIQAAGHDLGNHGESHKSMKHLSDEEKTMELMSVHNKVKELTGMDMQLFRLPYGEYDNDVILNIANQGYYAVQWSVDSMDWKDYGAEAIVQSVCENQDLGNGAIILCHNGTRYTAEALDTMIPTLKSKGYELVPVSQLIYRDNFHMDQSGRQIADQ